MLGDACGARTPLRIANTPYWKQNAGCHGQKSTLLRISACWPNATEEIGHGRGCDEMLGTCSPTHHWPQTNTAPNGIPSKFNTRARQIRRKSYADRNPPMLVLFGEPPTAPARNHARKWPTQAWKACQAILEHFSWVCPDAELAKRDSVSGVRAKRRRHKRAPNDCHLAILRSRRSSRPRTVNHGHPLVKSGEASRRKATTRQGGETQV